MPLRFNDLRRARSLTASPEEKAAVRERLRAYTEANPVREAGLARHIQQRSHLVRPALAFAAILLLIGAGTASAAEQALPDNAPLYFVKTSINEPVKRLLAFTPEAKASVEAELVTRRLEETETLAATGRLSSAIQERGEARFIQQVEKAQERLSQLNTKGKRQEAKTLSVRLEQKLQVHKEKLEELDAESSSDEPLTPMIKRLRVKTEALVHERERKEDEHRSKDDKVEKNHKQEERKKEKSSDGRFEQRLDSSLEDSDLSDIAPSTSWMLRERLRTRERR